MKSTASCTLAGHVVIIDSWAAGTDPRLYHSLVKVRTGYSYGDNWTEILADPGRTPAKAVLQMQLTNDAGGLLQAAYDRPRPASLDAQKTLSRVVARALGGTAAVVK